MSDHQEERTNGLSQLSSFSRRPGPAIQPFVDSSRRDRVNRKGFVPQISRLAVPYQGKLDWRKSSRRYLFMQREAAESSSDSDLTAKTDKPNSSGFTASLLSVGGRSVDLRDVASHWAEVGAELASMMDRMLDRQREKVDSRHIYYVDHRREFLA